MRQESRRLHAIVAAVVVGVLAASNVGRATPPPAWEGATREPFGVTRAATPEDRFAMAGGCYAVRDAAGRYLARASGGFTASASDPSAAEPFHFQATDLGSYLLYGTEGDFLAASEGALGEAAFAVTRSQAGAWAGGAVLEQTDRAAETLARSRANEDAGRGAAVIAATEPSPLADWTIDEVGGGAYSVMLSTAELRHPRLASAADGTLRLRPVDVDDAFTFHLTTGCTPYPEVEINVDGPIVTGQTPFQEVRGLLDAHLHMMAYEFIGGRVRCGAPWHRYGVAHALVDCPDHGSDGRTATLEQVLSGNNGGNAVTGHHTDGWPTFQGWPKFGSLTHEQVYYKWLERAWRGGLRSFINLLVDNRQLCQAYPYKRNSCNEMDGVRLQAQRIRELIRYIDAQNGGPGEGWLQIALDPYQARSLINEGKLAVILGIEVSVPLDCGVVADVPMCTEDDIDRRLNEVYDLGVRQMELVNKFDNALSGVTGDAGQTGVVVNQGNLGETGHYWRFETCEPHEGHARDKTQINAGDQFGIPNEVAGRDTLVGGILSTFGSTGVAPVYPKGPHCNVIGLSDLGRKMIRGLIERGMIFDPDHMSARARTEAMDLIEAEGYSGVVSSHSWADDSIYPRVIRTGGVVTPHAGTSAGFLNKWRQHRAWADPRYEYGLGIGSDMNGFSTQGSPRTTGAKLTYPFTGFGGVQVQKQRSGTKTFDLNTDGVAHYGLYPDWVEDVRTIAGSDGATFVDDLFKGTEVYLQMWERALGVAPDACRSGSPLTDAAVADVDAGMTAREVLEAIGQPRSRTASAFEFCMTGGRTLTVALDGSGTVTGVTVA